MRWPPTQIQLEVSVSGVDADICVLTFAVDRPLQLARCVASVAAQAGSLRVRHRILSERVDTLRQHPVMAPFLSCIEWQHLDGEPFLGNSSQRMALLRQSAVQNVIEPFVCFIDDDNEIASPHLVSLHQIIKEQQVDAAHSWRIVMTLEEKPFAFDYYPWHNDPVVATQIYRWCVDHGVIVPGDPVMRDGRVESNDGDGFVTVDMNEWLFRTELLQSVGFDSRFVKDEIRLRVGEDDKLYQRLVNAGIRFACSRRATLNYYLGGVSNLRLSGGPTCESPF